MYKHPDTLTGSMTRLDVLVHGHDKDLEFQLDRVWDSNE